jgi:uncharacterized integral membrane protein (TIGR00698 family)
MTSVGAAPRTAAAVDHRLWPGLLITVAGVAGAFAAHRVVGQVGVLTWAVFLGAVAANAGLLPAAAAPGLQLATRRLLRAGVVLLGFSLSLQSIAGLGPAVIGLVVGTLVCTLAVTAWAGLRLGLGRPRSVLVATGFAVCGAAAIAAVQENADAEEEDVAVAIGMVTLCGTVAMIALPLLQRPLGLGDVAFGVWAGASVHEVGQVVAAASPVGAAAVGVAVVVKLTRVLLLAPVVAGVGAWRRRDVRGEGRTAGRTAPPVVPLFVLGFLACVLVRSTGALGEGALDVVGAVQTIALAAALFGLGTGVHGRSLLRGSGRVVALAALSTAVVATVSLAGVAAVL